MSCLSKAFRNLFKNECRLTQDEDIGAREGVGGNHQEGDHDVDSRVQDGIRTGEGIVGKISKGPSSIEPGSVSVFHTRGEGGLCTLSMFYKKHLKRNIGAFLGNLRNKP